MGVCNKTNYRGINNGKRCNLCRGNFSKEFGENRQDGINSGQNGYPCY